MNKYLEKIATEEEKKKHTKFHPGAAIGAALAGSLASLPVSGLHHLLNQKVGDKINAVSDSGADLNTIRKYMRDTGLHKTTTFNTRGHKIGKETFKGKMGNDIHNFLKYDPNRSGPAYLHATAFGAKKNYVVGKGYGSGKINPDIMMHELGHAKDYSKFGKLKMRVRAVSQTAGPLAAVAALTHDDTRDYAPAIAAVPGAVMLRDEAAANYHAYKGIKAHKGAEAANKFVKKLLPKQMGGYALAAAAPVAATYVAKKILDKVHPKKK